MIEGIVIGVLVLVILGGGALFYRLNRQIEAVKSAVDVHEHTIQTQGDHLNAQGEALKHVEEVHGLMKAVLDVLDAPAMVKRWEDYRALVDHEREQIIDMPPQDADEVRTMMAELIELVSRLLLYTPSSERQHTVDTASVPSFLKDQLHRLAAAAPDRSTLSLTMPHAEGHPSSATSALSSGQPAHFPAMPAPAAGAEERPGPEPC